MENTFLLQIFRSLAPTEHAPVRKFLLSPFFNQRTDVIALFDQLVRAQQTGALAQLEKQALFEAVYPGLAYNSLNLNHCFAYLTERLEQYLAITEMQNDGLTERFYRLRAFRRRRLTQLFERDARMLERRHQASPNRHAGWHLFQYRLQNEVFSHRIVQRRDGPTNLAAAGEALGQFFLLENLRWACTAHALRSVGGTEQGLLLADAVQELADRTPAAENPGLALLAHSLRALRNPDDEAAFQTLTGLLRQYPDLFPPAESRDLFMSAINFCIRRQNQGERAFARPALELYREALERGILFENGVLPAYTYNNIHILAQVTEERDWARGFLDRYRETLPAAERDNIYRYNLAIFHYRAGDYGQVLDLLQSVEFSEVFINLDVRRMLLKSYFELGEWLSLASLLDSFAVFIRRQKTLGYHRDNYLNLIRFTKKLAKKGTNADLVRQIQDTAAVAERDWLLKKASGNK